VIGSARLVERKVGDNREASSRASQIGGAAADEGSGGLVLLDCAAGADGADEDMSGVLVDGKLLIGSEAGRRR
jgi:hypothetical protein